MENKAEFNAKCPDCGKNFLAEGTEKDVICPNCGNSVNLSQAKKYYDSVAENTGVKEAHGEDYAKVNALILKANDLIAEKKYEEAEDVLNSALELSDGNYRVYMAFVAAKTKNYTDLTDETHKIFLSKAITFADADEKKEISEIYRPYYLKRGLSEEELKNYSAETADRKKKKLEAELKSQIPSIMAKEKTLKIHLILFPVLFALGAFSIVFGTGTGQTWLTLVSLVFLIAGYVFFRQWFTGKDEVKSFNALLDLYDTVEAVDLSDEDKLSVFGLMKTLSERFLDRDPVISMSGDAKKLVTAILSLGNERLTAFLEGNAYYSQFIE